LPGEGARWASIVALGRDPPPASVPSTSFSFPTCWLAAFEGVAVAVTVAVEELKLVTGMDEVGWLGSCREVGRMLLYDMPFFLRLQGIETLSDRANGRVTTKLMMKHPVPGEQHLALRREAAEHRQGIATKNVHHLSISLLRVIILLRAKLFRDSSRQLILRRVVLVWNMSKNASRHWSPHLQRCTWNMSVYGQGAGPHE
jgi:hypothetical protein